MGIERNALQVLPPVQPATTEPEKKITAAEAESIAKEAGLAIIKVPRLEASAKIGQWIESLGARRLSKTTLAIAENHIEEGIEQVNRAISQVGDEDPAILTELIKIKLGMVEAMIKQAAAMAKTDELPPAQPSPSLRLAFPPHAGNINVAVVNSEPKAD